MFVMMKRIGIWMISWLCLMAGLHAQQAGKPLRIGVGLSGVAYEGDLTQDDGDFWRVSPGLNVSLQFDGTRRINLQLRSGVGRITEQTDRMAITAPDGVTPASFVETNLFFLDLRARLRLIKRGPVQPFLGAGLGFLSFSPRDQNDNFLVENFLSRPAGETYTTLVATFPLMGGVDVRLTKQVGLELLYTFRPVMSDHLDNLGSLGRMAGNDRLHELTLALHVFLQTPDLAPPAKPVEPAQDSLPHILANADSAPTVSAQQQWVAYRGDFFPRNREQVEPWTYQLERESGAFATAPRVMSLAEAAAHFQVSEPALRAANGPVTEPLWAGMVLWLPSH